MYTILLPLLAGIYAFICWREIKFGIYLIAGALPGYLLRFSIGPVPCTFLEAMILILFIVWVIKQKGRLPKPPKAWTGPILLLLLAAGISVLAAPDTSAALGILKAYFIEPILVFYITISVLDSREIYPVFTALGASALFVAGFGILQFFTGLAIPAPWDIEGRITSIFPYPNAVGLFLGPIVCLGAVGLYAAIKKKKGLGVLFWSAVLSTSAIAIILAQTEAAFVAIPVTLFLFSLFEKRVRLWTIPLAVFALLFILFVPTLRHPVIEKLTLQDYSGSVRASTWKDTIAYLRDYPLLGAGLSGFPVAIAPYHSHPEIEIFQYPHNLFLNIWVELGIIGLVAFFWLGIRVLKRGYQGFKSKAPFPILTAAILAPLVEMTIHGLVDVPYFKNDLSVMVWLFLALLVLISKHYVAHPKIHHPKHS